MRSIAGPGAGHRSDNLRGGRGHAPRTGANFLTGLQEEGGRGGQDFRRPRPRPRPRQPGYSVP